MSDQPLWDDTDPVSESVPAWEDTTPAGGYLEKTVKNIIPDLKQTAVGIGSMIKEGAYEMPKRAMQTGVEMAWGVPYAETPSGRQDVGLVENAPQQAEEMVRPLTHPFDYMQEHPVQQTLNILGAKQLIGGMMPKKAPVGVPEMPMRTPEPPPVAADVPPVPKAAPEPPPVAAPEPPPVAARGAVDPLQEVRDYVNSKYGQIAAKEGLPTRIAKYLKDESANLGAKDLGLQSRQIQSMGQGFKGLEKAEALVEYARDKGYMSPTLSDIARKEKIIATMEKTGKTVDAIRSIADKRAPAPVAAIKASVKAELEAKYGPGVESAPTEIKNVMLQLDKAKPTFSGMADLATQLNKSATNVTKLGQHPGPSTDAANIISRINNDAIRSTLNPKESNLYTESLRDYGAHKKLEQAVSAAGRRSMGARSNQRGIFDRMWQEALDRGGYRLGGNIAHNVSKSVLGNPGKFRTLPEFFEELAHQSNEAIDDVINGMWEGGQVPDDVAQWVNSKNK